MLLEQENYMEIDTETITYKRVIEYLTIFPEINNYLIREWDNKRKHYPLSLPYGSYTIHYHSQKLNIHDTIRIEHTKNKDKPVGESYRVGCLIELILYSKLSKEFLLDFLEQAKEYNNEKKEETIQIYNWCLERFVWELVSTLPKRDPQTVFLDKNALQELETDINIFLGEETDYLKFGIPYKRNYLLDGLPGTGKTSTIFSVASKLDMDISILNFGPKLDDYGFNNAISELENDTILVLEDIDSLFIDRVSSNENKSCVSFSGILNVLDGIARKHKLIIFMTTNHKEKLDPALIRPGRIDYNIHFDYATKNQITKILNYYFNDEDLTKQFIQQIKGIKLTTCVLQKYLFENRKNKENIISKIDELKELVKDYSKSSNLYT